MPTLSVQTNVKSAAVPDNLAKDLVDVVAKALGKPKSYVVVHVQPDQLMSWGGTDDPCAIVNLGSIGQISKEKNIKTTQTISGRLEQALGIKDDRMYIMFTDLQSQNVGYTNTTFATILG